jgi:hypothetical protein
MNRSRKFKAHQLIQRIADGPANLSDADRRGYNLWVSTWILGQLTELVPELKDAQVTYATSEPQGEIEIPGYTTREVR